MRGSDSLSAKPWFFLLKQELVVWGRTQGSRWVFVVKAVLAALVAMGLSMLFQLDQPRLAMITVFIVMRPQTGMILTKSLYRIGGTVAGIMVSFLLVGCFAQERVLFLLGLAFWVGICTAGAAFYRDFKSYGFVLAGYVAALAGLQAAPQPLSFFSLAVTRLSEVSLGIICAGVINDVIFPQRLSDQIFGNVQNRYADFIAFVHKSLSGTATPTQLANMQLKLVGDVVALESIRSAAILEDPEVRARDRKIQSLNSKFMAASTTFYSFHQLLERLTRNSTSAGEALSEIYDALGETLAAAEAAPRSAEAARVTARRIAVFRSILARKVEAAKKDFPSLGEPENMVDFETAINLLHRFLHELHTYTRMYATLPDQEQGPKSPDDMSFATHTDPLAALLAGARAFVSVVLVSIFWIATAWPYGVSALCFVAVTSALFGSVPDQQRGVRHMTLGHGSGFIVAFLFECFIMPSLDGFTLLCAALVPFLMVGPYIITYSQWAAIGTGYVVFFCAMLSPTNPMLFNPVGILNEGSAALLGTAIAGLVFMTLIPVTGAWQKRRLAGQIRRQVVMASYGQLSGLVNRFESGNYDLLHKLEGSKHLAEDGNQHLVAWIFSVKEIGRAIIHVREYAGMIQMPPELAGMVQESVRTIARLFSRISESRRDHALASVTGAIEALHVEIGAASCTSYQRDIMYRLLTSMHLIRTALLDEETVLAATIGAPPDSTTEGIIHAA